MVTRKKIAKQAASRKWLLELAMAVLVVTLSFGWYIADRESYKPQPFQVDHFDQADYRMSAEQFWGIAMKPETYDAPFRGDWGMYLRRVPFREIGVGTLYLISVFVSHVFLSIASPGSVFAAITHIGVATGLVFFWFSLRKRTPFWLAFACLYLVAFPPRNWLFNEQMLTEGPLRALFLFIAGMLLVQNDKKGTTKEIVLAILFLGMALMKIQWILAGAAVGATCLFNLLTEKRWKKAIITAVAFAAIPLCVSAVHLWGWGTPKLSQGVGLHVNHKTGGSSLRQFCTRPENISVSFCDPARPHVGWWNIYIGPDASLQELRKLDDFSKSLTAGNPSVVWKAFQTGLDASRNFPGVETPPWENMLRILDIFTWALLCGGLLLRRTRPLSVFGLMLWLLPIIGYIFSPFEARLHWPMAGIPLVIAVVVTYEISTTFIKNRKAKKSMRRKAQ